MSERKHTPAPWYFDGGYYVESAEGHPLLRAFSWSGHPAALNARLAAAAPDLLDACEALMEELDHLESTGAPCIPSLGVIERMSAAISKAAEEVPVK